MYILFNFVFIYLCLLYCAYLQLNNIFVQLRGSERLYNIDKIYCNNIMIKDIVINSGFYCNQLSQ